jgi:hypothetical protein
MCIFELYNLNNFFTAVFHFVMLIGGRLNGVLSVISLCYLTVFILLLSCLR